MVKFEIVGLVILMEVSTDTWREEQQQLEEGGSLKLNSKLPIASLIHQQGLGKCSHGPSNFCCNKEINTS